jgi:hypothetical protein
VSHPPHRSLRAWEHPHPDDYDDDDADHDEDENEDSPAAAGDDAAAPVAADTLIHAPSD